MIDPEKIIAFLTETSKLFADNCADNAQNSESFDDMEIIDSDDIIDCDKVNFDEPQPTDMIANSPVGCVVGMGIQAIELYDSWKNGEISDFEYLKGVVQAKDDAELFEKAAGIIIPVQNMIQVMGASAPVTFPVAFIAAPIVAGVVEDTINKHHNKLLDKAKFYQSSQVMYKDFMVNVANSERELHQFLDKVKQQNHEFDTMRNIDKKINKSLRNLYDSI